MIKKIKFYSGMIFTAGLLALFTNSCSEDEVVTEITDIDGNVYNTVTLFDQVWMTEDLKTTKFNDGTSIPNITATAEWSNLSTPGYCWYSNDIIYKYSNGALYNWYAVNNQKLCPVGWHVPTKDEITTLIFNFAGDKLAGGKLKETTITHWQSPNEGASNSTGFTALGGGFRDIDGSFKSLMVIGGYWSSTKYNDNSAHMLELAYNSQGASTTLFNIKSGVTVRCIKD